MEHNPLHQDRDSERDLLAYILNPLADLTVLDALEPDAFTTLTGTHIWTAARTLHTRKKRITKHAIHTELTHQQAPAMIGGHLDALTPNTTLTPTQATHTVTKLHGLKTLRDANDIAYNTWQDTLNATNPTTALHALHSAPSKLAHHTPTTNTAYAEAIAGWQHRYDNPPQNTVIPTPWDFTNRNFNGGFQTSRTYVIGGRPGTGKSVYLLNAIQYAAEQGIPATLYNLEMSTHDITSRLLSSGANVSYTHINRRTLSADDHHKLNEYIASHEDDPIHINTNPNATLATITQNIRNDHHNRGTKLHAIDYIQLINSPNKAMPREQQVSEMSRTFHNLAVELDICILVAAQLNRGNTLNARPPTPADLRESGSLEQDADVVVLLHVEKDPQGTPSGDVQLIVGKNRTGSLFLDTRPFDGNHARIR